MKYKLHTKITEGKGVYHLISGKEAIEVILNKIELSDLIIDLDMSHFNLNKINYNVLPRCEHDNFFKNIN